MGFAEASTMTKVGLGLSIAGLLFDLIGFPTPYWGTYSIFGSDAHYGIFQTCAGSVCASYPSPVPDWLTASQALSVIGFLFGVACVAVTVVFIFFKSDMDILKKVGMGTAFAAAGFIIVGAAVFAAKSSEGLLGDLNWSFALTIIGGVLYIATGIVMVIQ